MSSLMWKKYMANKRRNDLAFFWIYILWGPGDVFYLCGKIMEYIQPDSQLMFQIAQYVDGINTELSVVAEFIFVISMQFRARSILVQIGKPYPHFIDYILVILALWIHGSFGVIYVMSVYKEASYGWDSDFPEFWERFQSNEYVLISSFYTTFTLVYSMSL